MGGDAGPNMVMAGVARAARRNSNVTFLVHGDEAVLAPLRASYDDVLQSIEIRHTEKSVSMDAKPGQAVRQGKGTSMWNAIEAVKKGEASAAVSAGNTGALMAMAKLILRTMDGVHRPALCASWPTVKGICAVLDLGADITADAEQLVEFAIMGQAFAKAVHHKPTPSVGLLNIGSEEMKGNDTLREAAELIKTSGIDMKYHGFVEGNDISMGTTDVVVTDGFTGNVALKSAEGAAKLMGEFLRNSLKSNIFGLLGGLIATPALKMVKDKMDPSNVNGAVFLGLKGMVVKSHGGTNEKGFDQAITVAIDMGGCHFAEEIETSLKRLSETVGDAQADNKTTIEAAK
jgi:glycerol-3-phosphate acyltransferase PlsX